MTTMNELFSISSITVYAFLIFMGASLVKHLFYGDDESKSLQKIIGGIGVFITAILSENKGVFGISLFIGGLIIASENFMKFLAAVLRSSGDRIPETAQALNATKASKEDIEDKIEEE